MSEQQSKGPEGDAAGGAAGSWRDLVDQASDGIFVADANGRYVDVNLSGCQMLGYARHELCGKTIRDLIPPEDYERLDHVKAALLAGATHRGEWTLLHADGRGIPIELSAKFLPDGRWQAIVRDITERRRLQEALDEAHRALESREMLLRSIFENAFQFIGLLTTDGRLLEANRSALEVIGARREDVVGQWFWECGWWAHVPQLQQRLKEGIALAAAGRFVRFEASHTTKAGRIIPVDFSLSPVRDENGRVVFLLPEGRDITERKVAERALDDEKEHRLSEQQLLAELGVAIGSTLDLERTLTVAAEVVARRLADFCVVDVVEGDRPRRLRIVAADPAQAALAQALERLPFNPAERHLDDVVLETRQPRLLREIRHEHLRALAQDEQHLQLLVATNARSAMAVPLIARGRVLGALLMVSSRPERTYEPRDLALAVEVGERVAMSLDNARLYAEARQATRARDEVLGVVAHDLRNPLSVIEMSAAAARGQMGQQAEDRQRAFASLDTITRCVERADRLIQDLLDMRRAETTGLRVRRRPSRGADLLHEALDPQVSLIAGASLHLDLDVPDDLPVVEADTDRIAQVMANLIDNAIKFTPRGGHISIGAVARRDDVLIHVADSGMGVSAEQLPRLFDRYWQAHDADRRGAGLGLPIAKEIVEAHGGRIWAKGVVGEGCTFYFTLPIAARPGSEAGVSLGP